MCRKFERSIVNNVEKSCIALIICAGVIGVLALIGKNPIAVSMCMVYMNILIAVCTILKLALMPDFKYRIRANADYIVFEMSETDCRRINKNFDITSQTRKYLVLDDGTTIIKIAYNQYVLQFLKEIRES